MNINIGYKMFILILCFTFLKLSVTNSWQEVKIWTKGYTLEQKDSKTLFSFHSFPQQIFKRLTHHFIPPVREDNFSSFTKSESMACETSVSDDFSTDNYSSGTGNWASDWIEVNNNGNATEPDGDDAGQIQIISSQLRIAGITGADPYIYRVVDLENATAATLSFDLGSSGDLEESDNVDLFEVMISDDGGTTWTALETFVGDSGNGVKSYDILAYVSANTAVRFWTPSWTNDPGEYFSVDNVTITATCPSPNIAGSSSGNLTCSADATSITGTVFEDYNYNGSYDANEHAGIENITVTATDSLGNPFSVNTNKSGDFAITGLTTSRTYRLEFTNLPAWASPTFNGGDNGTTVQFVQPSNCANLGLASASDYCQTNPTVFVPCYEAGSGYGSNSTGTALISFDYNESGGSITKTSETTIDETGSTWGVAYDAQQERLFTSTVLKRAVGMGDGANADATGYIYFQDRSVAVPTLNKFDLNGVSPANSANAVSGGSIDLGTVNRNRVAEAISGDFDISDTPGEPVRDIDALSKAGVTAFGDIDITKDGSALWAVNLHQRSLIKIDLSASTATLNGASAATLGGLTNQYLIDQIAGVPTCGNGDGIINYDQTDGSASSTHAGNNDAGATGVLRPWALKFHKGRGYLGVVCDASISQDPDDLLAYVLSFDPNNIEAGFTEELVAHLDFYRRQNIANATLDFTYNWQPWIDNFPFTLNAEFDQLGYAQPILSDIEFVAGDDIVLGFIDRFILQNTWRMYRPLTGNTVVFRPESQGTLAYACNNDGVYEFEGTGSCTQSNGTYPGQAQNAQEYFETTRGDGRPYGGMGGLAVSKITGEILAPYIDPFPPGASPGNDYFLTQGIHWFDNSGTRTDWARISGSSALLIGKGISLGDVELMCDPAPLEIGNYVWEDMDGDGEQDAGESGISGVRMELYDAAGNLLAFDITNGLGHYFFSGNGIDDATWLTADDKLLANTSYYIVAGGNGQFTSGNMTINGIDYTLTTDSTTTGANRYEIDSDGTIAMNVDSDFDGEPYLQITTGNAGEVDHSFDFGFKPKCILNITTTYSENCTEPAANNFTADWKIGFEVAGAPDNAISYQRNSDAVQTHTLTGATDTLTISGIPADGGSSDTLKVWFTNDATCADTMILKRPLPCPSPISFTYPCLENMATSGTASGSSEAFGGMNVYGIDGNTDGIFSNGSVTHTGGENDPWWMVDLGSSQTIEQIEVWNRTDDGFGNRLDGAIVEILNTADVVQFTSTITVAADQNSIAVPNIVGQKVRVRLEGSSKFLSLAEVQVFAPSTCPGGIGDICQTVNSTDISGSVWEDYNYNGIMDETELVGIQGIQVVLTDDCGSTMTTTYTDSNGNYQFIGLTTGTTYRVEFILPEVVSCWAKPTQAGVDNGTTVQFVQPSSCANLGLTSPQDYCDSDNPLFTASCFVNGDIGTDSPEDALVTWAYNESGTSGTINVIANKSHIGSVHGIAYDRAREKIYAAANLKRNIGMGPSGLGAIYEIDPYSGSPNGTLLVNIPNVGTVLSNAARGLGLSGAPSEDPTTFSQVGSVGLGDIDISEDNQTLYVVNLYSKKVYLVDIASSTVTDSIPIPDPNCNLGEYRPGASNIHRGKLYVGVTCDASGSNDRADLSATVYEMDLATHVFNTAPVLQFPLNYLRDPAWNEPFYSDTNTAGGENFPAHSARWYPWENTFSHVAFNTAFHNSSYQISHPTPWLIDIEFGDNNELLLGFADRTAAQFFSANELPDGSGSLVNVIAGGDILKADLSNNTYVMESLNYTGSPVEFFGGEEFRNHQETALGGLGVLKGKGEISIAAYDPFAFSTGGIIKLSTSSGNQTGQGFQLYAGDIPYAGKGGGIGDLETICAPPPIEIGNYVWIDTDSDGIQDACENGIPTVTVELVKGGSVIASTQTDINGQYYFSDKNATDINLTWVGTGVDTALIANTMYTIRISNAEGGSQQAPLNELILTTTDANSNNLDNIDNDATLNGLSAEITAITGDYGCVDHDFDFGFRPACEINITLEQDCNDNNTGAIETDDYIIFTFDISNTYAGTSNQYQIIFDGNVIAEATYESPTSVEYTSSTQTNRFLADNASTYTFTIRDKDKNLCLEEIVTTPVDECSSCPPTICLPVNVTKTMNSGTN